MLLRVDNQRGCDLSVFRHQDVVSPTGGRCVHDFDADVGIQQTGQLFVIRKLLGGTRADQNNFGMQRGNEL